MSIITNTSGGSTPQMWRGPEGVGSKPLFHSVRDIALIIDKTVNPGFGVLKAGTVMAECAYNGNLIPYPSASANNNDTKAKAYLIAQPADNATDLFVTVPDSYKFTVGASLIIDGSDAGTAEVQSAACATPWATGTVYVLTFGGQSLTVTVGATETLAGVVALLQAATGYSAMPFTVTAGTNALTLTWKVAGAVATKATLKKDSAAAVAATTTTAGVNVDQTATSAENLGAITAIDRTYASGTQAKITVTTGVTTGANFSIAKYASAYVKGADESSSPFTKAKYILDKDIDTGTGENAKGANTSVVISNAVLYTTSLIGLDAAAITDMGIVTVGRFSILK